MSLNIILLRRAQMTHRIGFCCKWIDTPAQVNGIKVTDDCKKYNTGTTTVAWLNRQTKSTAESKLWSLIKQNIEPVYRPVSISSILYFMFTLFAVPSLMHSWAR